MFDRLLQLALSPGNLTELVIRVYLIRIDLDSLIKVFKCSRFLSPLKVDEPELNMGIGISRVYDCVMQESFKVLSLTECIPKPARFAAQKTSEVNHSPKDQER